MLLSKDQILSASDRKFIDVDVPEWGGSVRLAVMSGTARDCYEASLVQIGKDGKAQNDLSNIRAKLVSACLVDANFEPIFTAAELGKKSGAVLDRLFDACNKLNAVTDAEVEQAAKN